MERDDRSIRSKAAGGGLAEGSKETDLVDFLLRPPAPPEAGLLRSILSEVVQTEIVPQLIVAEKSAFQAFGNQTGSRAEAGEADKDRGLRPSAAEREQFEVLVLYRDTFDCFSFVNALRARGVSLTDIYLGLFQPVAEHLGQRWTEDSLSFMEVTKAVGQIQTLVHTLGANETKPHPMDDAHRIVLASQPHEQHSLGMLIMSELFELRGWDVEGGVHLHTGEPLDKLVHREWFGVVGLSASSEDAARQLKASIDSLRQASRNDSIAVIVGGSGFVEHPELSAEIGADGVAADGADAVETAEQLLRRSTKPHSS